MFIEDLKISVKRIRVNQGLCVGTFLSKRGGMIISKKNGFSHFFLKITDLKMILKFDVLCQIFRLF